MARSVVELVYAAAVVFALLTTAPLETHANQSNDFDIGREYRRIVKRYPSVTWFRTQTLTGPSGVLETGDWNANVYREMKPGVAREQLDELFRVRIRAHDENVQVIKPILDEYENHFRKALLPLTDGEFATRAKQAFEEVTRRENEAEGKLAHQLTSLLSPDQYSIVAASLTGIENIDAPLAASWLRLDESQQKLVRDAIEKYQAEQQQLDDLLHTRKISGETADARVFGAAFRILVPLTPEQLEKE